MTSAGAGGGAIEVTGDLDRRAAEALRLEIQRLARRYGLEIDDVRIEDAPADPS